MVDSRTAVRRSLVGRLRSLIPGRAEVRELPALVRIGSALLAPGLVADLLVHGMGIRSEGLAAAGHLLILIGMLLAVAGAIAHGIRQSPSRREEM